MNIYLQKAYHATIFRCDITDTQVHIQFSIKDKLSLSVFSKDLAKYLEIIKNEDQISSGDISRVYELNKEGLSVYKWRVLLSGRNLMYILSSKFEKVKAIKPNKDLNKINMPWERVEREVYITDGSNNAVPTGKSAILQASGVSRPLI